MFKITDANNYLDDLWRYALIQDPHDYTPSEYVPNNQNPDPLVHKDTNPKDAVGISKVPMSTVPAQVIAEIGLGMLEGSLKYGRHNYRIAGVRSSVYYDAALRHLIAWWEGQDIDPDSGLSHITKAMASLTVLRDAMINDKLNDDRPPPQLDQDWVAKLNKAAKDLIAKYPNPVPAYTRNSK